MSCRYWSHQLITVDRTVLLLYYFWRNL